MKCSSAEMYFEIKSELKPSFVCGICHWKKDKAGAFGIWKPLLLCGQNV